jgi:hypothetical protein
VKGRRIVVPFRETTSAWIFHNSSVPYLPSFLLPAVHDGDVNFLKEKENSKQKT